MKRHVNASVYQPKRRRNGKLVITPVWWMKYRLNGDKDYTRVSLHCRDKQVAEQKLAAFVREKEQEATGMIAPKPLREAAGRSVADHLADYLAVLRSQRRDGMYVYNVERHVTKLIRECGWKVPRDVTADSFEAWRAGGPTTKKKPIKGKTLNDYLADIKGLLAWMQRTGRLNANPLAGVEKVDTTGQEQERRALTDDEFARLLDVAGDTRKAVYLVAGFSGLRRKELSLLRWGDVRLNTPQPFLSVRASTTKNSKAATIWLVPEAVAELQRIRPGDASDAAPVFGKSVPSMDVFRADLAAAGIAEKDAQGRVVVFHSLRHTLATNLARAGVAPVVAMQVMRHSDYRLTMKHYTDMSQLPTAEAMERLTRPRLNTRPQAAVATGTDGRAVDTQKDTQKTVHGRPLLSLAVQAAAERDGGKSMRDKGGGPPASVAVTCQGEGEVRHLGLEPRTR